jgi:hypothetical protein
MSHPYCVIVLHDSYTKWTMFISVSRNGTTISPLHVITSYNILRNVYLSYRRRNLFRYLDVQLTDLVEMAKQVSV